jgi:hypothetical protein
VICVDEQVTRILFHLSWSVGRERAKRLCCQYLDGQGERRGDGGWGKEMDYKAQRNTSNVQCPFQTTTLGPSGSSRFPTQSRRIVVPRSSTPAVAHSLIFHNDGSNALLYKHPRTHCSSGHPDTVLQHSHLTRKITSQPQKETRRRIPRYHI